MYFILYYIIFIPWRRGGARRGGAVADAPAL
jgi:hypothetical protein